MTHMAEVLKYFYLKDSFHVKHLSALHDYDNDYDYDQSYDQDFCIFIQLYAFSYSFIFSYSLMMTSQSGCRSELILCVLLESLLGLLNSSFYCQHAIAYDCCKSFNKYSISTVDYLSRCHCVFNCTICQYVLRHALVEANATKIYKSVKSFHS